MIVDRRAEVMNLQNELQGHCYDMEYSIGWVNISPNTERRNENIIVIVCSAIKSIEETDKTFKNIQELVKKATFLRQQLKFEENRRQNLPSSSQSSVYKRLSGNRLAIWTSEPFQFSK